MAISGLFEISRRSLSTYQKALEVTSNNIANANNPYFSRQRVVLGALPPDSRVGISVGLGVKIEDIQRVRDQINDAQTIKYNQAFSSADKQSQILSHIESLFSEPTELGLSGLINDFFNAWEELAVNPASTPLRTNVIQSAEQMSSKIKTLYEGLDLVRNDQKLDAQSMVDDINSYLEEIQELNKQIYDANIKGNGGFDLLDKRNEALQNLSKLVNVNVSYDDKNMASVSVGGVFAVDRMYATKFQSSVENGKLTILSEDGNAKVKVNGGELFAITNSYNKLIPDYLSKLDLVSQQIFDNVNSIHSTGYSNTNPQATGINFFSNYSNGVLEINSEILNDPNRIAVSSDGTSGNGDLALRLAELKSTKMLNGLTISENYSDFVSSVANEKVMNDQKASANELVLQQLEQQQSEYSGVSIDEEMMDIIKFQRSYDASAKLISIADDLLQTLLNMV
ncbi:MAG: flagellar hook-associated protein FlgK [Ignavibacteria bacterium]|nr:flagellar hook-associated protein FlgK [Ignavibacteria bacterium]